MKSTLAYALVPLNFDLLTAGRSPGGILNVESPALGARDSRRFSWVLSWVWVLKRREPRASVARCRENPGAAAFTLIELVLVLAILAVVTSLAAPSLFNFFRGRTLDSEARQLLALTHAGQSRAVSEGFPMLLWIDSQGHAYGLQAQFSSQNGNSQDADPKAEEFTFGDQLQIEALNAPTVSVNGRNLPAIRFLPDGTIDESSPATVRITSETGETLWLIEATNRLSYAIQSSDK